MGIADDWSYIRIAQVLAQTGHIVYVGWSATMLGWQLYLGALFVKLFGFSFTVVRSSTLVVAVLTAFLLQRVFVQVGNLEWNATLGTLAVVLSPLYLSLAFSFMSDMFGLFCIVLCLYSCLRALQSGSERSTIAWICFAALSNGVGGTSRQIAWIGVLVIVPCTLWLLRRKPRVLLMGGLSCLAGIGIAFAAMHWFSQQPYTTPAQIAPAFNRGVVIELIRFTLRGGAEFVLLLLPVVLMFAAALRTRNHRMAIFFGAGCLSFVLLGLILFIRHKLGHYLAPFNGDYVSVRGLLDFHSIMGERPVVLNGNVCLLLTIATAIGLVSLLTVIFGCVPRLPSPSGKDPSISWHDLAVIFVPCIAAYILLLVPVVLASSFFDRYLLPLMALLLPLLVRYYQERVGPRLPVVSLALIGIYAAFSVASLHDVFAMYRGSVAAIEEIRSSGVPATAISGSGEYNGWTQIVTAGYVNNHGIIKPPGAFVHRAPATFLPGCEGPHLDWLPALTPIYALSFDSDRCDGLAAFPPVTYHTWLAPHATTIYVLNYPAISRH
jgi:hypothetical protein